jgi:putative ABC transport system substrate-binding protein
MVFGINGDPVEAGLVASLARPGGNLTGITALTLSLTGKRLEMLKEARPGLVRVAALANASHPGVQAELRESRAAAARLGLALQYVPVSSAKDFDAAFAAIAAEGAQALLAFPDTLMNAQARVIADFALQRRLPTVSGWAEFTQAGNLMSYGPNLHAFYRHLAGPVDKLLRGAKPADLPVEQPTQFELVINLKTAKALGLAIPPSLLLRADEVIQ